MKHPAPASSPRGRRRPYVRGLAAVLVALLLFAVGPVLAQRQYVVAFANLTEEPGVTVEGTGFTGRDIRESFVLAARAHPIEMVYYDNQRDDARALQNVDAAIARKVDLYIQYHQGAANAAIAEKLKAAGIRVLALNYPVPGAPLYTVDNAAAGRVAGEALARFALRSWRPSCATAPGSSERRYWPWTTSTGPARSPTSSNVSARRDSAYLRWTSHTVGVDSA